MKINIPSLICCLLLYNCHNSQIADGGPCSYSVNRYQAEVISIDSTNPSEVNIKFVCSEYISKKEKDTFSYFGLYNSYLTSALIREKKIHPGQKIPFQVDLIETGSCNPRALPSGKRNKFS